MTLAARAAAQAPAPPLPGDALTIYLVTIGAGTQVWERFGHNAILVHDHQAGTDIAYNYGMFDFNQPHFLANFVKGRMRYWMTGRSFSAELRFYRQENRSIWLQELALAPGQRAELRDFLEWNAREENRFYRYDYYRDNCSTRVRDAIDRVIDHRIASTVGVEPSRSTYRFHSARLVATDPGIYTGMMLGLGHLVDRPITRYEEMFLPFALHDYVRRVSITGPDGGQRPLVAGEDTLYVSTADPPRDTPPPWFRWYLTAGLAGGLLLAVLGAHSAGGTSRLAFSTLAGFWSLLAGLAGLGLASLWLFTDHAATYRNENLFQFSPLSLVLMVPILLMARSGRHADRIAARGAVVVAAVAALGLVLKVLPGLYQVNGEFIALALPIHAGIAWGLVRANHRPAVERRRPLTRRSTDGTAGQAA